MDDATFRSAERLQKRRQYLDVYDRGEKFHTAHLVVYLLDNGLAHHRLGITASRKVGDSVVRNRIKRRLREIFRTNKPASPAGWDIVINVKKSAAQAPFEQLLSDFRDVVGRREGAKRVS